MDDRTKQYRTLISKLDFVSYYLYFRLEPAAHLFEKARFDPPWVLFAESGHGPETHCSGGLDLGPMEGIPLLQAYLFQT